MSLQPPQHFNEEKYSPGGPITTIEIARQINQLSDLEAQIDVMMHALERLFTCEAFIWISEELFSFINPEHLHKFDIRLIEITGLVQQAIDSEKIVHGKKDDVGENNLPTIIAAPLLLKNTLLGVVQLERSNRAGFTTEDLNRISDFCFQTSLVIEAKRLEFIQSNGQKSSDTFASVIEINKSISSNLDLENQINSLASLLCQKLGYCKVTIFSAINEQLNIYSRYSMSEDGTVGPEICYIDRDGSQVSEAIAHRQMIVRSGSDEKCESSTIGTKSHAKIVIPIQVGGEFYGVIELCSDYPNVFSTIEKSALQSIADNFAIAYRNAKLFRHEHLKRSFLEDFHKEISSITFDESTEEIFNRILPQLYKYISFEVGALWLIDNQLSEGSEQENITALQLVSAYGSDNYFKLSSQLTDAEELKNTFSDFDIDDEENNIQLLILNTIEATEPVITRGYTRDRLLSRLFSNNKKISILGIPLIIDAQSMGAILLFQSQSDEFANDILPLASTFAGITASLIQTIRNDFSTHDQLWITTLQQQTMESYQSITSTDELNEFIARIMTDVVGANACTLYFWDEALNSFSPQSSYGFEEEQQNRLNDWDVLQGTTEAFDSLLENKTPVIVDNINLKEQLAEIIFPQYNLSVDLLILFPLIARENFIGTILIDFTGSKLTRDSGQKTWDDVYATVQALTNQAAIAIDNLQQVKLREEEAYISVALLQVAQAVVSLTKLDDILGLIVRITPLLVGVKRCVIYLWKEDQQIFHPSHYYGFSKTDIQFEGQIVKVREFPFVSKVFDTNQIVYYPLPKEYLPSDWNEIVDSDTHVIEGFNAETDQQFTLKLDEQALRDKARLLIGFPLSVKGDVLGVMVIEEEESSKGAPFYHIREKRIEIVRGITQQAALAIQNEALVKEAVNSERMERELQLAREIQQTFLPQHLPNLPGWEVSVRWKPARQVAGDFYDFIPLNENQIGFVIADVADKGMPAALFMILIRTLIRAAAKDNLSPAVVLRQVNELLIQDSKNGMFVTVFYAVMNLSNGEVVYVNAGHNPPVLIDSVNNTRVELTRTSMALGLLSNIEIEERKAVLFPGDGIFFYTDGVTEAFSTQGEMYGTDRLNKILENFDQRLPDLLLDLIDQSVQTFIDSGNLSDDITMAAFYRC